MKPKPWIYAANFLLTALLIFGMAVAGKGLAGGHDGRIRRGRRDQQTPVLQQADLWRATPSGP